ncbi:hypothetical protein BH10ACT7_BH10ACT7_03010 [soil metagenome]
MVLWLTADFFGTGAIVPPEPIGGVIRVFQSTDATGRPALVESVREVRYEGLRSITETVMDILRPLSPRETESAGVFAYTDPASGAGWMRMEGFRSVNVNEVQQAVRTLAIDKAIGQSEPVRQEVLSFGNALVPRTTNPYVKIAVGVIILGIAVFGLLRLLTLPGTDPGRVVAALVLSALAVVCVILIANGFRRRAWWHRARAEARRQGVELPDRLKTWN